MILLLDNYDSFTWNLQDCLAGLGHDVAVRKNDGISLEELISMAPDAVVLSPGPGVPANAGITMELIRRFHSSLPILGICLGHQALGEFFGARLVRCTEPVHGKTAELRLLPGEDGLLDPVFEGISDPLQVMRYHSLRLEGIQNTPLRILAETTDRIPMAIRHVELPLYGFQFHPESVLTPQGPGLLRNWLTHTLHPALKKPYF